MKSWVAFRALWDCGEWYVVYTERGRGCTHEVGSGMISVTYRRICSASASSGQVNSMVLVWRSSKPRKEGKRVPQKLTSTLLCKAWSWLGVRNRLKPPQKEKALGRIEGIIGLLRRFPTRTIARRAPSSGSLAPRRRPLPKAESRCEERELVVRFSTA